MTVRNARLPAAIAVDTLWSFAAAAVMVRLISDGDGPAPSFVAVAAVVLASFAVARGLPAAGLTGTHARVAAVVASAAGLYLILHTEYAATDAPWRLGWIARLVTEPRELLAGHRHIVAGAAAATLLWLLGVARWSTAIDVPDVLPVVALGFAAVALAAIVDPPTRGPHAFGAVALAFFVLAWCLLALYQTADADEPLPKFGARWGAAFAVVIAASAVFVFVVAAFDPRALGFLEPVGLALLRAAGIAVAYTLGPIVSFIGFLFGLIPLHPPKEQPTPPPPAPPLEEADGETPRWIQIVGYVFAGGGLTVLALSFVAAIWIAMRRYTQRKPRVAEQRRTVERDNMLAEDLAALLDGIARRFRRPRAAQSSVEIRRLYHQMLARAETDGLPRPPAATPLQFAPHLDARYASGVPSAISRAFVTSRYGLGEIESRTVRDLRAQWQSLLRPG